MDYMKIYFYDISGAGIDRLKETNLRAEPVKERCQHSSGFRRGMLQNLAKSISFHAQLFLLDFAFLLQPFKL